MCHYLDSHFDWPLAVVTPSAILEYIGALVVHLDVCFSFCYLADFYFAAFAVDLLWFNWRGEHLLGKKKANLKTNRFSLVFPSCCTVCSQIHNSCQEAVEIWFGLMAVWALRTTFTWILLYILYKQLHRMLLLSYFTTGILWELIGCVKFEQNVTLNCCFTRFQFVFITP